jgi:hypothetical protein
MSDVLAVLGLMLIGVGLWFLLGWPSVVIWSGVLLVAIGVGEARTKAARGRMGK